MWRLRFYNKDGVKKGDVSHEEDFDNKKAAEKRYREVFVESDYSLNPTIWYSLHGDVWERMCDDFKTTTGQIRLSGDFLNKGGFNFEFKRDSQLL